MHDPQPIYFTKDKLAAMSCNAGSRDDPWVRPAGIHCLKYCLKKDLKEVELGINDIDIQRTIGTLVPAICRLCKSYTDAAS